MNSAMAQVTKYSHIKIPGQMSKFAVKIYKANKSNKHHGDSPQKELTAKTSLQRLCILEESEMTYKTTF